MPGGAFYVFPDLRELMGKSFRGEVIKDDLHLAQLVGQAVALVPGSPFGHPDLYE